MLKKSLRVHERPPRRLLNANLPSNAMRHALAALLQRLSETKQFGHSPDLGAWKEFVIANGEPPLKDNLVQDPTIVGQSLATFITNGNRRHSARSHGLDHEIRSALGVSVRSLSQLVEEVASVRTDANSILNDLVDDILDHASGQELPSSTAERIAAVRSVIRELDVCANEQRRHVNSRLASLRIELLDLGTIPVHEFHSPRSPNEVDKVLQRFAGAARQLGESLSIVTICLPTSETRLASESESAAIAMAFRNCFQREVDFVSRMSAGRSIAILIDTPKTAVKSLLAQLSNNVADFFAESIFDRIQVHIDVVPVDMPLPILPDSIDCHVDGLSHSSSPQVWQSLSTFVSD